MIFTQELAAIRTEGKIVRERQIAERLEEAKLLIDPAVSAIVDGFIDSAKKYAYNCPMSHLYEYWINEKDIEGLSLHNYLQGREYFAATIRGRLATIGAELKVGGMNPSEWSIVIRY